MRDWTLVLSINCASEQWVLENNENLRTFSNINGKEISPNYSLEETLTRISHSSQGKGWKAGRGDRRDKLDGITGLMTWSFEQALADKQILGACDAELKDWGASGDCASCSCGSVAGRHAAGEANLRPLQKHLNLIAATGKRNCRKLYINTENYHENSVRIQNRSCRLFVWELHRLQANSCIPVHWMPMTTASKHLVLCPQPHPSRKKKSLSNHGWQKCTDFQHLQNKWTVGSHL